MVVWMCLPALRGMGVNGKEINLHPGGCLGVQQQVEVRGWLGS